MATASKVFSTLFGRYLVVTNTVASGCLMGAGDVVAQMIEKGGLCRFQDIDKKRTGRYATFGLLIGPFNHAWYGILDKLLPHVTKRIVLKKIALDQSIAGPLNLVAFFMGLDYLEGKTIKHGVEDVKSNFWNVYKMDCAFWPAAQMINFYWIPRQFRMLYVCGGSLAWDTFLTYYRTKHIPLPQTNEVNKSKSNVRHMERKIQLIHTTQIKRPTMVPKDENKVIKRTKSIAEKIKL